jgi:hypothetical protein
VNCDHPEFQHFIIQLLVYAFTSGNNYYVMINFSCLLDNSTRYDLLSKYFYKICKHLQLYYETLYNLLIYLTDQCQDALNSPVNFSFYACSKHSPFLARESPIRMKFMPKNPLACHDVRLRWSWNERPCLVVEECLVLISHGCTLAKVQPACQWPKG